MPRNWWKLEADLPLVVSVAEGIAPDVFPGRDEMREAEQREIMLSTRSKRSAVRESMRGPS